MDTTSTTPTDLTTERREALRWLIDNRRAEVTTEQAIKTLRRVLRGDAQAQAMLDDIAVNV